MIEPFWHDDHLTLYGGDCRDVLRELPAESVHCVVTSPPYWGLRDYGTATWEGGDEACDHRKPPPKDNAAAVAKDGYDIGFRTGTAYADTGEMQPYKATCGKCGARRIDSQLGLEPTPEEFVANMVAVFREVRRVLRKDGTLWLNLGDSYGTGGSVFDNGRTDGRQSYEADKPRGRLAQPRVPGLKPKDLVGIPWRVAFALQADGWYLRSDIIWSKPNPMPESVTDRPTKAHEYLFLLTKSPKYFYDADAVREEHTEGSHARGGLKRDGTGLVKSDAWNTLPPTVNPAGRNLRSVWTIATEPYPGAHFATFPRKLVEPCVKAGTSERGVCPDCGAPWVRVVERTPFEQGRDRERNAGGRTDGFSRPPGGATEWAKRVEPETTGWAPTCHHYPPHLREGELAGNTRRCVPAVVLDPFAGSGTTLLVAQALGRRGIGIDLSPDYLKQALARNAQTPLGLVG